MTMFYFIGTGKQVKDLVANYSEGKEFINRTKRFKARAFPPATWAILFTMATMILGGGVDTRVLPSLVHSGLATIALYYNLVAFVKEAKCMIEHNMLMEEVDRFLHALPPPSNPGDAGQPVGDSTDLASPIPPSAERTAPLK
jgi:hypothetical protein